MTRAADSVVVKAFVIAATFFGLTISSQAQETPHIQFVSEYIRQLGKIERIRSLANDELQGDAANRMAGCVRSATRFQLELQSQILMLQSMRLNPPFETLAESLASFNERKASLYKRMSDGCAAIMSGPKPGVDYDAIAADAPKVTAELEYVDNALFEATPLVFATLIDPVPDTLNHMSKLIITNAERKKLIADINYYFGGKLDQKDQNSLVSAASVLKGYLLKDYTSSDQPQRPRR
jgi:hypothetical protein